MASYWMLFRLIFVFFSLYLMGDAFFRWDGFRYYASFSEFIPSVALVTVLWSILAVFTALIVWVPLRSLEWFCLRIGWKIRMGHLLLFIFTFAMLGAASWIGKRFMWPNMQTYNIPFTVKLTVFISVTLAAIFLTWLLRNKTERLMSILQERITPLVWLFGILAVLSLFLATYYTFGKRTDNVVSQMISKPSVAEGKRLPNIILVTFDALTSRDMSVYGYQRPTTPFITKWAQKASLFTRAEAEGNITTPTTASLMTGKRLWTHQTYQIAGSSKPVKGDVENLALLLKDNNYYTMAFVANRLATVKTLGIAKSFGVAPTETEFRAAASLFGAIDVLLYRLFVDKIRIYDWIVKWDFITGKLVRAFSDDFSETEVPPEKVFNSFLRVIDDSLPEPFFAWIHLFPPHDPYLPPEPYMGMFDSSPELRLYKGQENTVQRAIKFRLKYQNFPPEVKPAVDVLRARYDEFIRYCDKQFEDFISQLKIRNKLKNTVIILSSDHGESFEHNYVGHGGGVLYEQVTHIPLIIKEPGQTKGQIINDLVEQIDIPATILELANIPVPSWMEGRSLVPIMRGKRLSSRPVFSMEFASNPSRGQQITKGNIAVWEGDYKLIHYLGKKKSLLFNLKQDPGELNNLFDKELEVGQRLLALIQDNLKKANEKISKR